jgi:hypothetical protein
LARVPLYRTETTACCGWVSPDSTMSAVTMKAETWSDTLTLSISQKPSSSVMLSVEAYFDPADAGDCLSNPTALMNSKPETLLSAYDKTFTNTSEDLSFDFAARFPNTGCGVIAFSLTGDSLDEYETGDGYAGYIAYEVGASDSETPPPELASAKFGDAGNRVLITLDSASDQGSRGLGLAGSYVAFPCSELFEIESINDDAACMFTSSSTVEATMGSSAATGIGDSVVLLEGKLYAFCDQTSCNSWSPSGTSSATISGPDTPLTPTVSITGVSSVPSCNSIQIDASTSSGSGGRSWSAFSWSFFATSSESASDDVAAYLDNVNNEVTFNPVLVIPNEILVAGEAYYFKLTLTNFMGESTTSSHWFEVMVQIGSNPLVAIVGEASRTMLREEALSLFAEGQAAACPDEVAKIIPIANYLWTVEEEGADADPGLASISVDNRYFKLAQGSLKRGSTYVFTVKVTDDYGLSSSAQVRVEVGYGPLVAVVSGGGRAVAADTSSAVVLSGVSSYDADFPQESAGVADGFSFAWSCVESTPQVGRECDGFYGFDTVSAEELVLGTTEIAALTANSDPDATSTTFSFELVFTGPSGERSASVSTSLEFVAGDPPEVAIEPILVEKVNPSKKLQVKGSVVPHPTYDTLLKWSSEEVQDLSTVANSQLETVVAPGVDTVFFNLVVANGALTGSMYSFRLTASNDNGAGYADVQVVVNSPPLGGVVEVNNGQDGDEGSAVGVALDTMFKITASGWVDDVLDLPLTYSFYYVVGDVEGGVLTDDVVTTQLAYESLSPSKENVLLPVGGGKNNTITVVARVGDKYGSKSNAALAKATVTAPVLTTEELSQKTSDLTQGALAEGNTDLVFQVLEGASSVLNDDRTACDDAPDCVALHRRSCEDGVLANTCGKCEAGYLGADGGGIAAGNDECVSEAGDCQNGVQDGDESDVDCGGSGCGKCAVAKKCGTDDDCYYGGCTDGVCAAPLKSCAVSDCNGNGECMSFDANGDAMAEGLGCYENDACSVECVCSEEYYGAACSKLQADREEAVQLRTDMLTTLAEVTVLQDVSAEAVNQQASTINALASDVGELSDDGLELAVNAVAQITSSLQSTAGGGLDTSAASQLGDSISNLMVVAGVDGDGGGSGGEVSKINEAIDNLAEAQVTSLFVGEAPAEIVTENLKISSQKLALDSIADAR